MTRTDAITATADQAEIVQRIIREGVPFSQWGYRGLTIDGARLGLITCGVCIGEVWLFVDQVEQYRLSGPVANIARIIIKERAR